MKRKTLSFVLILSISLVLSIALFLIRDPGDRYVFMFESASKSRTCMEARFLPKNTSNDKINMYVNELLLGPVTQEYRPLFSRGTRADSCFVRDNILYVNLSDDLIYEESNASEMKKGIELFRKNILYNFNNIHTIEVFIAGNHAYEVVRQES